MAKLSELDMPVVVVAGNHDQPRTLNKKSYLSALYAIRAPNFHYFDKPGSLLLNCKRSGKVVKIIGLPFLPLGFMRPQMFEKFLDDALSNEIDTGGDYDYLVAAAHFHVQGAKLGNYPYYLPVGEIKVPRRIFRRPELSYVALGHIHLHQELEKNMVYAGSVERINFGEEDEDKGFVLVEAVRGELSNTFIKLPCRPLITLPKSEYGFSDKYFNLGSSLDPTGKLLSILHDVSLPEGAIVRLMVKLDYGKTLDRRSLSKFMDAKNVLPNTICIELKGIIFPNSPANPKRNTAK